MLSDAPRPHEECHAGTRSARNRVKTTPLGRAQPSIRPRTAPPAEDSQRATKVSAMSGDENVETSRSPERDPIVTRPQREALRRDDRGAGSGEPWGTLRAHETPDTNARSLPVRRALGTADRLPQAATLSESAPWTRSMNTLARPARAAMSPDGSERMPARSVLSTQPWSRCHQSASVISRALGRSG